MTELLIQVSGLHWQRQTVPVLNGIDWQLRRGQHWAIMGASGAGKSVFCQILAGQLQAGGSIQYGTGHNGRQLQVAWVPQQHQFSNRSHIQTFYYQQRFNSSDAADSLTIREYLQLDTADQLCHDLLQQLQLQHLADQPLIQLSNGENKRLQLVKALRKQPDILILDSPFTGLDAAGRQLLDEVMSHWIQQGVHWIVVTEPGRLPACTTHIALLENGLFAFAGPVGEWQQRTNHTINVSPSSLPLLPSTLPQQPAFDYAVQMRHVTVKYEQRIVLNDINWKVARGERWSISGPNGAGKSTLLSLIAADNPQAYANEIYLFDQRRGSGESIWDIKKKIGFVSPELHLYFDRGMRVADVVASGLFDTIGLFRILQPAQEQWVQQWLRWMELHTWANSPLFQLPLGVQRMVLLARAFVKLPPLLILDEPCQGLDGEQSARIKAWIEHICSQYPVSLLYVTHYPEEMPACITRHLQLQRGQAQEWQPPVSQHG